MPSKYVHTSIEGRALKLSNLDKVLYPSVGITKAEVIQYYLSIAPTLLRYMGERPLTVIRFPDGVEGKRFYSKDKPAWTPEWIESMLIAHDEKDIDYLVATNTASVVWLANLACLELHPTQFVRANEMRPDFFIIDLDPDEKLGFEHVKEATLQLREFLRRYDYTPYVKTSGSKGLHIYVPIKPQVTFDQVKESLKSLMKVYSAEHEGLYTLNVGKNKRQGKILLDIYRNHLSNTCVAPYSLRGKPGAPVSMPIRWEDVEPLEKSAAYHLKNYQDYLDTHGDVWANWRDDEVGLHDQRGTQVATNMDGTAPSDERLKSYQDKRDFKKTAEPTATVSHEFTDLYCVQLHDASNLHYDLRLEDKGVLLSWAIPKGLPFRKGQKRLAIQTEDHPIKYLTFEGVIPKGEYGAGEMWLWHTGKIIWKKKKEGSYHFTLQHKEAAREYKLFKTGREDQWLVECYEDYNYINAANRVKPMLASASRTIPTAKKYAYEVKWDGIRVLLYFENDEVKIYSRNGNEITDQFPELQIENMCRAEHAVLDAEIVVLDEVGRPRFHDVISRMHKKGEHSIKMGVKTKPVTCYVFDLLSLDGYDVMHAPLQRRREWLDTILRQGTYYRMSQTFADGEQLFAAIEAQDMEGIMAKDQTGKYRVDSRTDDWIKIKCRKKEECHIIGYTAGEGDRVGLFGAMHLVKYVDGSMQYMGKVGTGYDHQKLESLYGILSALPETDKPIPDKIEEEHRSKWVEPRLSCEIEYASLSSNGTYREPVFIKLTN